MKCVVSTKAELDRLLANVFMAGWRRGADTHLTREVVQQELATLMREGKYLLLVYEGAIGGQGHGHGGGGAGVVPGVPDGAGDPPPQG